MRCLKNKRAEGYIDVAVTVLVIALVIALIFSIWSMVTLKQDMTYIAGELLEAATVSGRIGPEVEARFAELCAEAGFTPTVRYSATYFDATSGKIQLGDVITVTLTTEMVLPGFGGFELPFDVSVTKSGLSKIYWK
jgi:hypothetical protein